MRNKVLTIVLLSLFVALAVSPASYAKTVLKLGTSTQPSHIYNLAAEQFGKIVAANSNGDIEVQVFPASQLGSERDMVEGLQLGSLEMTLTSTGRRDPSG